MELVTILKPDETVRLDSDRLGDLYNQLGEATAENIICRAMEELAIRIAHCDRQYSQENWVQLRKSARSIVAIADQIGMRMLSRVATDLTYSVDRSDAIAMAATLARLTRIGERSLTAIWDLQDLSV